MLAWQCRCKPVCKQKLVALEWKAWPDWSWITLSHLGYTCVQCETNKLRQAQDRPKDFSRCSWRGNWSFDSFWGVILDFTSALRADDPATRGEDMIRMALYAPNKGFSSRTLVCCWQKSNLQEGLDTELPGDQVQPHAHSRSLWGLWVPFSVGQMEGRQVLPFTLPVKVVFQMPQQSTVLTGLALRVEYSDTF